MKSLAKCVFVVVLVFQCAQTVLGCTSCYCRVIATIFQMATAVRAPLRGDQQCAGPMHQEAQMLVPGFRVDSATLYWLFIRTLLRQMPESE